MAYAKHLALQPYLRQTKTLFDPDRILNPGRLCY
jgi:FAD/FMN-containing dehydrogenase